jgi:Carbohydrate family 9 binding domain-like
MRDPRPPLCAVGALFLGGCFLPHPPAGPWLPERYVCYRAPGPIAIDGRLDDEAWRSAPWTGDFVDIQGDPWKRPRLRTRVKMLWDDACLYVAAELEEPDLWATLTERDAVIFQDDDFEVFLDPDGDTHAYGELEINALGTEWDLFLEKPYAYGGHADDAWDIAGLRTAVCVDGTLNRPGDVDRGWSVEIALPWAGLERIAGGPRPPRPGTHWRVDFSRVEWRVKVRDGRYEKRTSPATGRRWPERNWVWSPQEEVAMHAPETWGLVFFSPLAANTGRELPPGDPAIGLAWALRLVHRAERAWSARNHGAYTADLAKLDMEEAPFPGVPWPPRIELGPAGYRAYLPAEPGVPALAIDEEGRLKPEPGRPGR